MANSHRTQSQPPKIVVLRWGHRPQRDVRLTTHVALTARALCASGFVLADVEDQSIKQTVERISARWGGNFKFEMGISWKKSVHQWRADGGVIVHLTAYGENIQASDVLQRIKETGRNVMVLVGSQKVPGEFYSSEVSDFNVAVGNQPHSECAALAVFLDRFFEGKEFTTSFEGAKIEIMPKTRGKAIRTRAKKV